MTVAQPLAETFVFGLVAAVALTAVLRRLLLRAGLMDVPTADRWHRRPVARPGGPAIVAVVLAGVAVFSPGPMTGMLGGWLAGGVFIFLVGLVDDFASLPSQLKLTLLVVAAAIPVLFGVTVKALPPVLGAPLAMLWILGLTNAVNWLDNMDGLAAGVCAIAAGTLVALSIVFHDPFTGVAASLLAGTCAGFLFFNFSPASIFMGDSGSGFLGLTLAVLALSGPARHVSDVSLALIVPVMVLSIPIFDTAVVTISRLWNGRPLFQGGTDHPSHRLVVLGLSERQAVLRLWGFSALSAAAAVVASRLGSPAALVFAGLLACGFTALGLAMARVRVYEGAPVTLDPARVVLVQMLHKRSLLAIILDFILICVAYISATLLRFEGTIPPVYVPVIVQSLPIILAVKLLFFYSLGLYRTKWRYVGLLDLLTFLRASLLASVACVAVLFLITGLRGYSRAVLVLDWILTFGLLGGMRLSLRVLEEYFISLRTRGKRVLIFGAGRGGVLLLHELRSNPSLACHPVGFVDDDTFKQGDIIRGLPVLGTCRDIPALAAEHRIQEVLVAAPSLTSETVDRIALICTEAGVAWRLVRPLLEPAR
jgi:UDP-GlcNAc:undecaprenyl-phosphate/decaprenyl-phosphate GlcNAc-1-phosphate transferase